MTGTLSLIVSVVALAVSIVTAWLTFGRAGRLCMTQPTVIWFGPDGGARPAGVKRHQKVFLRTLLYSTAQRGQTIESLHVSVQRSEARQNFPIWTYGTPRDLTRGSGLFVPREGVVTNHHFLLPSDGSEIKWLAGDYVLRVYAKLASASSPKELAAIRLQISDAHARELTDPDVGIYFDWGPDQQAYHPHIDRRPQSLTSDRALLETT